MKRLFLPLFASSEKLTVSPVLRSGLGNQMWQIAVAQAVANRHGRDWFVPSNEWVEPICSGLRLEGKTPLSYRENLFSKLPWKEIPKRRFHTIKEEKSQFVEMNKLPRRHVRLSGYFQHWRYFGDDYEAVRKLFPLFPRPHTPREKPLCVVGFRGTDYYQAKGGDFHVACTPLYYQRAIERLKDRYDFVLVTNDQKRARECGLDFPLAETSGDDVEDFHFIAHADALIMANSSFHWWAAFLGKVPTVLAPSRWFGKSGPPIDIRNIVLPEWVIVSVD